MIEILTHLSNHKLARFLKTLAADICFKYVSDLQPGFEAARLRMHAAKCEHRIVAHLDGLQQRKVEEVIEGLEEVSLKQQIMEDQQKDLLVDRSSPLRKFDLNLVFKVKNI